MKNLILYVRNAILWTFLALAWLALAPLVIPLAFTAIGIYINIFLLYYMWDREKALKWSSARLDNLVRWRSPTKI